MKRVYVTGAAGFIGYHLADLLLGQGFVVHGHDGMTTYYDPKLKEARLASIVDFKGRKPGRSPTDQTGEL